MRELVFGYGSLAAESALGPSVAAALAGYARGWGVAMDNRRDLPGYKYYTAADGSRPPVFVAFLDVARAPGGSVSGVCRPVDAALLAALDRRERNYVRVDVSERVAVADARVWTYVGRPEARERLRAARAAGRAVIDAAYRRAVLEGFATRGDEALRACRASLEPGGLPVLELVRHELPGG